MILKTSKTIALKNQEGGFDIKNISVFSVGDLSVRFSLTHSRNKKIILRVKCPLCGNYHSYIYCISDFLKRDLIIGGCELIGIPLFYLGDNIKVEEKIEKINKQEKKLYAYI